MPSHCVFSRHALRQLVRGAGSPGRTEGLFCCILHDSKSVLMYCMSFNRTCRCQTVCLAGYARVHESRVTPSRLRSPCEDLLLPTTSTDGNATYFHTGTSLRSSELGSLMPTRAVPSLTRTSGKLSSNALAMTTHGQTADGMHGASSSPRLLVRAARPQE